MPERGHRDALHRHAIPTGRRGAATSCRPRPNWRGRAYLALRTGVRDGGGNGRGFPAGRGAGHTRLRLYQVRFPSRRARDLHDYALRHAAAFPGRHSRKLVAFPARVRRRDTARVRALSRRGSGFVGLAVSGSGRRAGERSRLRPVLWPVHRGQCPGAGVCRHDRSRVRLSRRQRDRARPLPSTPPERCRGPVSGPEDSRRGGRPGRGRPR